MNKRTRPQRERTEVPEALLGLFSSSRRDPSSGTETEELFHPSQSCQSWERYTELQRLDDRRGDKRRSGRQGKRGTTARVLIPGARFANTTFVGTLVQGHTQRVRARDVSEWGRVSGDWGRGVFGTEAGQAAAGGGEASGDPSA